MAADCWPLLVQILESTSFSFCAQSSCRDSWLWLQFQTSTPLAWFTSSPFAGCSRRHSLFFNYFLLELTSWLLIVYLKFFFLVYQSFMPSSPVYVVISDVCCCSCLCRLWRCASTEVQVHTSMVGHMLF